MTREKKLLRELKNVIAFESTSRENELQRHLQPTRIGGSRPHVIARGLIAICKRVSNLPALAKCGGLEISFAPFIDERRCQLASDIPRSRIYLISHAHSYRMSARRRTQITV